MFERKKYKSFALQQLKNRWTVPVLMTLITTVILEIFNIPAVIGMLRNPDFIDLLNSDITDIYSYYESYSRITNESSPLLSRHITAVVTGILDMAGINVYLKMSRSPEKVSMGYFFEGFNLWARALLATLWKYLWVFLWSLLFLIPGIIKSIAYSQMFYILNEYENVSVTKAMRISMLITNGHKWDLFVTHLSFIGWAILCCFTMGIGFFWLEPYINMTLTNAYHAMMKEALVSGKLRPEDLTE